MDTKYKRRTETSVKEEIKECVTLSDFIKRYTNSYLWLKRYGREDLISHLVRDGRGRKPKDYIPPGEDDDSKYLKKPSNPNNIKGLLGTYTAFKNEEGIWICGRCSTNKVGGCKNNQLCRVCYNNYFYLLANGKSANLGNIRDEYCNIKIKYNEKEFYVGNNIEEGLLKTTLYKLGYDFIFKSDEE